jgi:hypothetical protein
VQPGQKKRTLLYAGIGFVAVGVASIVLIYMLVYQPLASENAGKSGEFNLAEIHSVSLARHDHVSLSILVNGGPVVVPEEVGMNPQLWHDHSLDRYGPSGISPMHTHDNSGTIHIESTTPREYTVSEFLAVMGIKPDAVTRMTVNGNEVVDIWNHAMNDRERIQLELTIIE